MAYYSVPSENAVQDTLASTLAAAATTATSTTDISSKISNASATNPMVMVIDRIDSNGTATPTKREYVSFTGVSGTSLTGLVRGLAGSTDQEHAAGAVIEFVPDVIWAQGVYDSYSGASTPCINFIIDGGGYAITTGVAGDLVIPFACTITAATLLADQSGSIVIDVWKDTYANFPPTNADSITASAPPTISTATKSTDTTLTGWTKTIAAGSVLRFNVDSCTTITRVTLSLSVTR